MPLGSTLRAGGALSSIRSREGAWNHFLLSEATDIADIAQSIKVLLLAHLSRNVARDLSTAHQCIPEKTARPERFTVPFVDAE